MTIPITMPATGVTEAPPDMSEENRVLIADSISVVEDVTERDEEAITGGFVATGKCLGSHLSSRLKSEPRGLVSDS